MFAGHYDEAAATFRELAKRTDAPRVKLELARSLYLGRHYREAKHVFNDVYYSNGLPYRVRRGINVYLEKIDRKIGYLVPTLGLGLDTNPTKGTAATDFVLFGVPVVLAQHNQRRAIGAQYSLSGRTPLNASSTLSAVGAVSGVKYPRSPNSFVNANLGLSFDDAGEKLSVETGMQYSRRENSDTLVSPYILGIYRLNNARPNQTDLTAIISFNSFEYNSYLNGPVVQTSVRHGTQIGRETILITTLQASVTRTADARYNQVAGAISANLYRSLKAVAVDVVVSGAIGKRIFAGADPLFGSVRRDTDSNLGVQLFRTRPIRKLFPSIGIRYERRDSSLPFYSYAGTGLTADLLYRF